MKVPYGLIIVGCVGVITLVVFIYSLILPFTLLPAATETPKATPIPVIEKPATVVIAPEPEPAPNPHRIRTEPAPTPAVTVQPAPPVAPPRPAVFSGGMAGELIASINAVRANAGLAPVYEDGQLNQSALIEANTLCSSNVWAHGDYAGIMLSIGYNYLSAGENLAKNFVTSAGVINGWTNSPSHYANMVGDYVDAGMAVITCNNYQGRDSTLLIVSHFGKR